MFTATKNFISGSDRIIPVVMFHSIGLQDTDWVYCHISEPLDLFEEKIVRLKESGFNFIFWADLYEYMTGRKELKTPAIMLTFDDGYLDNWVLAYPILKKHGAKGTIFVNPEFVDPSEGLRKNLDNVWKKEIDFNKLILPGFLNWNEMREMERSGVIDIQSHANSHTWYFCSDKIIDFHHPGNNRYPWLAWNAHPTRKPFYMQEKQEDLIPYGYPVYQFEKSLICNRYFPSEDVVDGLIGYVEAQGGKSFFERNNYVETLKKYHADLMTHYHEKGRYETKEEYRSRIVDELTHSKKCIEKYLSKQVEYICWPGGGYNEEVLRAAKRVGYKAWTLSSRDNSSFRNMYKSATPHQVKRIGSSIKTGWRGKKFKGFASPDYFLNEVKRHQGNRFADISIKLYKFRKYIFQV